MSHRRSISPKQLTHVEVRNAAQRMMAGAQAHQRASAYCLDNPTAKFPSINRLFFSAVSFELILNSIEQSLRLILLLHHSALLATHNISALYKKVVNKSGGKGGIRSSIVTEVNALGSSKGMGAITESDIQQCLRKHDSSYSSFRYFGLDENGRSTMKWEMKAYEIRLLHCLALALIKVNFDEMRKRNIGIYSSFTRVPESEITEELQQLMGRMKEQSTR